MLSNPRGSVGALHPFLGSRAGGRQLVGGNRGEGGLAVRHPCQAERGAVSDAGEPGPKARRLAEIAQAGVGLDERVLGSVEGGLDVAEAANGDGEDGLPVTRDEFAEGAAISGEDGQHELSIGACVRHGCVTCAAVVRVRVPSLFHATVHTEDGFLGKSTLSRSLASSVRA
jgi:hypothetical protein